MVAEILVSKPDRPTYTADVLESFDNNRHIELEGAYGLVEAQEDERLPREKLERAVDAGEVHLYEFDGTVYVDRLDVGRVYHEKPAERPGMRFNREFSTEGQDPLKSVGAYTPRDLQITDYKTGDVVWEQKGVEFPSNWDEDVVGQQIVAQKYFFKPTDPEWKGKLEEKLGRGEEHSIAHLTRRVTDFFTDKGDELGYFASEEDREAFRDDLAWLQINRMFAFNSPVQFNAGLHNTYGVEGSSGINYHRDPETGDVSKIKDGEYVYPQCHACFIKGPRDDLESIAGHVTHEMGIFSAGSGIGQDIGILRELGAPLSGGGKASGSMSFLRIYDKSAGTVKSGGKSRRAARMTTMRGDHPDIEEFVNVKVGEDKKALVLMENGYSTGMDGEAYLTVDMQNTNVSARLQKTVFEAARKGQEIELVSVKTGEVTKRIPADRLMKEISFGTWRVGDPGIQYEDTIHEMHTAKNSGRQKSTNPCGEYMFLDDTSCNLGSLNMLAFADEDGNVDADRFRRAVRIATVAQDIANDAASMPVKDIATVSPEFRTVGVGYANMGALLMRNGVAYDSDEGRSLIAGVTALMTGTAYETSTELAETLEPFTHYEFNAKPMQEVMEKHRKSLDDVVWEGPAAGLQEAARKSWDNVVARGAEHGFRNAQTTVIAPTGTISFLMGCDTTGIEPSASLAITKNLAGGGNLTMVNKEVPNALRNLGYGDEQIRDVEAYITEKPWGEDGPARGTIEGAPHVSPDHYEVFHTAFGGAEGTSQTIHHEGHIRAVAAAQPFVSGGISKTMNFPQKTTVKEIYDAFMLGDELGLKGITAFRNESKPSAALSFITRDPTLPKRGEKVDLPRRRQAFEIETEIGGTPIHVLASEYENGLPGQITFLSYKPGSTIGALLTTAGIQASRALKRGVSLDDVTKGWVGHEFEPKGLVHGHPHIKTAVSPLDLAGKLLRLEYMGETEWANDPNAVDVEQLHGAQNGAFYTLDRQAVDAWDIDAVLNDPEYGGFVNGGKKAALDKRKPAAPGAKENTRGVICKDCGNPMKQTSPGCFSCNRCGEKVGGCGL